MLLNEENHGFFGDGLSYQSSQLLYRLQMDHLCAVSKESPVEHRCNDRPVPAGYRAVPVLFVRV